MADQQTGQWDILGIGSSTVDEFLVARCYPDEDSKEPVVAVDRQGGGLIATALVTLARLGLRCAYADQLGTDEMTAWIEADLRTEGVDVSLVAHHPQASPIHAFVVVSQSAHTRTILYTVAGQQLYPTDYPPLDAVAAARLLLIDDVSAINLGRVKEVVHEARRQQIPVIGDFEMKPDPELLASVDHLIISQNYAERAIGSREPLEALDRLWRPDRTAVVITAGADGCWYQERSGQPHHLSAFDVLVEDTTGCGDVFHGGYAAGLYWGWDLHRRVRLASACAALKARKLGGRRGIPTRAEVEAFLAEQAEADASDGT